jgi:hypothetical protein
MFDHRGVVFGLKARAAIIRPWPSALLAQEPSVDRARGGRLPHFLFNL